jgi:L-threonylcarbamoyladenylate synthase
MPSRLRLNRACHVLANGGVVAYPTEAVWGLGCEPLNRHAFARLLELKRRPPAKGVILIASDFEQLRLFIAPLPRARLKPALDTWPGAATWLVPAAEGIPEYLTGGRGTLAVRVTAHPVAAALCAAYGGAIVSTSANVSGQPPARTELQVRRRFGNGLDFILSGDTGGLARPTPIRDLATGKLLRR